jgi:hypothetical protein
VSALQSGESLAHNVSTPDSAHALHRVAGGLAASSSLTVVHRRSTSFHLRLLTFPPPISPTLDHLHGQPVSQSLPNYGMRDLLAAQAVKGKGQSAVPEAVAGAELCAAHGQVSEPLDPSRPLTRVDNQSTSQRILAPSASLAPAPAAKGLYE